MSIPREFINLLLAKIDLVDLISTQIPLKKKSGANYFACCPFHNEKTASFSVSQTKQFYYCFGCGAHGNAIDFMMNYDHLPFPEAVQVLAKQTGMSVPESAHIKQHNDSLLPLYEVTAQAAKDFYQQMCHSPRAIQYLKQRGIDGRTAKEFTLGFAPNQFERLSSHASPNTLKNLLDVGLIIKRAEGGYYDRFRDRILFPIHDYRGRIIGFGGRIIDQGEPKYLNSPETVLFQKGHELYGLYHALQKNRRLPRFLIVEGYMDVIALFQNGITYAVATLGTATTEHQINRLLRYASELVFSFDGDKAGRTAAWRALQTLLPLMQDNLQVRFLFLPEGEDPDSLINQEGKTAFEKRIQGAMTLSTFFFQKLSLECDMDTLEGRSRFASLALDHLKLVPPGLYQSLLLEELAKRARISVQQLSQKLPLPAETKASTFVAVAKTKLLAPMRLAMALLVQNPSLADLIQETLPESHTPGHTFLLNLINTIKNMPISSSASLLELWRHEKEREFLVKLLNFEHNIPEAGMPNEFLGAIRQLKLIGFDHHINRLLAKAAQEDLTLEEKKELNGWIAKKKNLSLDPKTTVVD